MEVAISAAKCDQGTEHILQLVHPYLVELGRELCGDYGGKMDHLWIDLELCPGDADRRDAFSFRFQRRVAPSRDLVVLGAKEHFNVGHYSVRPDYFELARIPLGDAPCYLMQLIYESTELLETRKQIRGFDAKEFRTRFAAALSARGCAINKRLQPFARENAGSG